MNICKCIKNREEPHTSTPGISWQLLHVCGAALIHTGRKAMSHCQVTLAACGVVLILHCRWANWTPQSTCPFVTEVGRHCDQVHSNVITNFQICWNFPNLRLEPDSTAVMGVSAVWICLHRLMVVGTTPAETGEWRRAGPLFYWVSLHQHPQTGPGIFQTNPSILQKPRGRVHSPNFCQIKYHARNVSKCKECKEERKFCWSSQSQAEHIQQLAPGLIAFWICAHITFLHREGDRCASIHLQLGQSVLSVGGTWTPSSSVLLRVLLGLSLISFV